MALNPKVLVNVNCNIPKFYDSFNIVNEPKGLTVE